MFENQEMSQYIATFFSHYGAMRYKKKCKELGLDAEVIPVPRSLSSSCGICVRYTSDEYVLEDKYKDELEQIVRVKKDGYENVYASEE